MDSESPCTKTNLLTDLTEEILTVALRETEFGHQKEPYQFSVFDYFGVSGFLCKGPNALLSNQVTFYEKKNFN